MCHKKFENWFTNQNLTPKNVFEKGFLHGKMLAREVTVFQEKLEVLMFYLKLIKATPNYKKSLPGVQTFE